ncbi:cupin superfamily protein [Komagataeibacter oboediens]|nr:cupin superfamily protein [Komagataeibacter oboediens]
MIDLRDPSTPPESVRRRWACSPIPKAEATARYGVIPRPMARVARYPPSCSCWRRGSGRTGTGLTRRKSGAGRGGSPLVLEIAPRAGGPIERVTIGPLPEQGQVMQAVVPAGAWQAAFPEGAWSLTGCQVAPAFVFSSFELAPPGWSPQGEAE